MIKLGTTYHDKITGYIGTAVGITKYLTGCVQVLLEGKYIESKNEIASFWFDESRLKAVLQKKAIKVKVNKKKPAGPQKTPPSRH